MTEELTDRAAQLGYLTDGGEVHLTVDSKDARWKTETENRLKAVIVHDAENVTVIIEYEDLEDLVDELEDILEGDDNDDRDEHHEDDDDHDDDDHSDEHHDDDDDEDDDHHEDDDDDDHHDDDHDDDDDD